MTEDLLSVLLLWSFLPPSEQLLEPYPPHMWSIGIPRSAAALEYGPGVSLLEVWGTSDFIVVPFLVELVGAVTPCEISFVYVKI